LWIKTGGWIRLGAPSNALKGGPPPQKQDYFINLLDEIV